MEPWAEEEIRNAPNAPIQDMMIKTYYVIQDHEKIEVSVSGGSDSDILMDVVHRFDSDGKATYVFFNTGLEYDATKRHLTYLEERYGVKIEWVDPIMPIPTCCTTYGVPFWSKRASDYISRLQRHGFKWEDRTFDDLYREYPNCKSALRWWCNQFPHRDDRKESSLNISYARWLKEFLVEHPPEFQISAMCCEKAKKGPSDQYEKVNGIDLKCTGVRKSEGGIRATAYSSCFSVPLFGPDLFLPLFWLTDQDKQLYKDRYGIVNSDCYEVWGTKRTGCCGCPFGKRFEEELDLLERHEPKMYRATNNIFGASYEYTRAFLRFRAQKKRELEEEKQKAMGQMSMFE